MESAVLRMLWFCCPHHQEARLGSQGDLHLSWPHRQVRLPTLHQGPGTGGLRAEIKFGYTKAFSFNKLDIHIHICMCVCVSVCVYTYVYHSFIHSFIQSLLSIYNMPGMPAISYVSRHIGPGCCPQHIHSLIQGPGITVYLQISLRITRCGHLGTPGRLRR